MSDCDSEVFSSGGEDSDVYSHRSDESRHFGAPEYSSDPADLTSSTRSSPDAHLYHHAESGGSIDFNLESPAEMWDSDNSLSLHLLPDGDSDQNDSPGVIDDHDISDPDDEILAKAPCGLRESHFQLLCEGSEVTLIEGMILIFQYALKFSLTNVAIDDLLKLIGALLPQPNLCLKTAYSLKKMITTLSPHVDINRHVYCSFCNMPVEDINLSCHGDKHLTHFVTANLGQQLYAKFQDPEFWNALKRRQHVDSTTISDIHGGAEYSTHSKPGGFLCPRTNPANISFTFNTDGVPLFRSSQTGIWPLFLVINELPPATRFSTKNVLLCGLWYCKDKPNMHTYLKPFIDSVNKLYKEGITVHTPDGEHLCRGMILTCTVDLPAKAAVCNMKGFNGAYSCATCLDSGDNTIGETHMHRYWPFSPRCEIRTVVGVQSAFVKASQTGEADLGYKGFPILALHQPFNVVNGVVVDYLHCVLLGVMKMLMEYWFNKSHRSKPYHIGKKVHIAKCNERLLNIYVPDLIRRRPRSICDCAHWKGTEFQGWLLWYSLPVLNGILPEPYYQHYSCFVASIGILLEAHITRENLDKANALLETFCKKMSDLYGGLSNRMNVHLLRHLTYHVKNWGPLWAYSCFGFESFNGELKKYYHGTRNMNDQLMFSFMVAQSLPRVIQQLQCIKVGEKKKGRRTHQYAHDTWRVGNCHPLTNLEIVRDVSVGYSPVNAMKFYRIEISNLLYYSKEYKRSSKSNNYTVTFETPVNKENFAVIKFFIELQHPVTHDITAFAVVEELNTEVLSVHGENVPHLHKVLSKRTHCIPVESIRRKCILIPSSCSGSDYDVVAKIFDYCHLSV